MSVEHSEQIQEEDESNSLSKPSTVESIQKGKNNPQIGETSDVLFDERTKVSDRDKCDCDNGFSDSSDVIEQKAENTENGNCEENVGNIDMLEPSEEATRVRHGVKRM